MKKLMMVLLMGMVALMGCDDAEIDSNISGMTNVSGNKTFNETNSNIESNTRPAAYMQAPGEDKDKEHETTNEQSHALSPGENFTGESIGGFVQTVGNMQFEVTLITEEDIEGIDLESEVGVGLDSDAPPTTILIDEQTVFEIVQSDGMSELDRWEGSFDDISIDCSVNILGEDVGGEFLARQVTIWEWTFDLN